MDAVRSSELAPLPLGEQDDPNPDVRVLCVDVPPGNQDLSILFSPRWDGQVTG
jgi:hypothetical protein